MHAGKHEPLSVIALRIVQEALASEPSIPQLAKLAASDPAFAIRVIATVNSAAFGISRPVTDVHQAASLLGARGLKNVGLSLALDEMIPPGEKGRALFAISLRRAAAARLLAEALGQGQLDDYFTAGLFLEVGVLACARDALDRAAEIATSPAAHRVFFEITMGYPGHPETGAQVATDFKLSEATVRAVRHHHDPESPDGVLERICWAAERMAAIWEGGHPEQMRTRALDALSGLGIETARAGQLLAKLPEVVRDSASAFDRDLAPQVDFEQLVNDAHQSLVEMNNNYEGLIQRFERLLEEKRKLAEELQLANEQLAQLAATDPLTELPNRRAFRHALARDLARAEREKGNLGLVVLDIDHFKRLNDTWGHPAGDQALKAVAGLLSRSLRSADLAARIGGEEFVVVLPSADDHGACLVAERLRQAIAACRVAAPEGTITFTASFGVASVRGPGCAGSADDLFTRADAALYEAKRGGRNRVCLAHGNAVVVAHAVG